MRRLALAAVLLAACSGGELTAPVQPPPAADLLSATWVVQAAVDEQLPGDVVAGSGRWLGGSYRWSEPGQGPRAKGPGFDALRARVRAEDAVALSHLEAILLQASCRLARVPGSFDAELALGYEVGAAACAARSDAEGEQLAIKHRQALNGVQPPPEAQMVSGVPVVVQSVDRDGTSLRYSFVRPTALRASIDALGDPAAAAPGPTDSMADSFAARVGTSRWFAADRVEPDLPTASALFAALPKGGDRIAASEEAADGAVERWKAGIAGLPDPTGALDASARALLTDWAGRALEREFGLLALDSGEPELALVHLEAAAGNRARTRPEPGLDPALLCGLARARFEANELRRTVDLLEDIGASEGWAIAREVARTVARVAVLPTAAEAKVNR